MADYMDIDVIRMHWDNGEYLSKIAVPQRVAEGHIFDENLSVKRNREMVEEHNANVRAIQKKKMSENAALARKLTDDVVAYLMGTYHFTEAQARKIEAYVDSNYHSYMSDYFYHIDEYADFISDIIKMT